MAIPQRMAQDVGMPDKRITPATSNPIPVDWNTLQSFRSSVGDAAADATARGATRDAGALSAIQGALSNRIDQAGAGQFLKDGENFPLDVMARWMDANAAHAARINRFDTGPLAGCSARVRTVSPRSRVGRSRRAHGALVRVSLMTCKHFSGSLETTPT